MSAYRKALWGVLFAAPLVLTAPTPAVAWDGVVYEVAENMKIQAGKVTRRVAVATLVGTVNAGTPWCPAALGAVKCDLTAIGWDTVDVATGRGPVNAYFTIVVQGDNPTDGPEWAVLRGSLSGTIDLSPAVLGYDGVPGTNDEMPFGTMTGSWTVRGVSDGPLAGYFAVGRLRGTFRLPFTYGGSPAMYMDDQGGMMLAGPGEHSLGVATVRLEITFIP